MTQSAKHPELNPDQIAVAQRHLRDILMGAGTLAELLKKGEELPLGLAKNVLSVSEHKIADLGKLFGVDTVSEQKIEERHAEMRRLNMRVRELEGQIGASYSPGMTQMGLGVLSRHLSHWWEMEGFGHIAEEHYDRYGATIKFSCSLFGGFPLIGSDTPVSDAEHRKLWLQSLRDRGFDLCDDDGDRGLVDNENNRRVLLDLFAARIPSAIVVSFGCHSSSSDRRRFTMRDVEVRIRQLADIAQLPEPPAEQ